MLLLGWSTSRDVSVCMWVSCLLLLPLQAVFEEMDQDHDGIITGQQLHEGLAKMGAGAISERDVAEFLKVSKVRLTAQGPMTVHSTAFNQHITSCCGAHHSIAQRPACSMTQGMHGGSCR